MIFNNYNVFYLLWLESVVKSDILSVKRYFEIILKILFTQFSDELKLYILCVLSNKNLKSDKLI
jgi:hypothetical protein